MGPPLPGSKRPREEKDKAGVLWGDVPSSASLSAAELVSVVELMEALMADAEAKGSAVAVLAAIVGTPEALGAHQKPEVVAVPGAAARCIEGAKKSVALARSLISLPQVWGSGTG